jgi:hypothetical protein
MKTNYSLPAISIAAITDPEAHLIEKGLNEAEKIEIQVDWTGGEGTLDATVQVYEKLSKESTYILRDDAKSVKVLSSAAGKWIFSWPEWIGYGIKIVVTKNNCTAGSVIIGVGIR